MQVRLLITGGTIDKEYDILKEMTVFTKTHLPEMLNESRNRVDIISDVVMLKDSLEMKDSDRKLILDKCKKSKEERILVTHGTSTMAETACVLGEKGLKKTIVLTGAMVPFSLSKSDALFNLGGALSAAQILSKGVYIVMNGKIFNWNNVRKNKKTGDFENIR